MVDEVRAFGPHSLDRVVFAVFGSDAYSAFSSSLGR